MKKILLTFSFAIVFVLNAFSQISYGVHAGIGVYRVKNFIADNALAGFTGGVHAQVPIAKSFTLQPEVNFQMEGSRYNYRGFMGDIANAEFEDSYRFNYLNIPILVKYQIPTTTLNVFAGPQSGFLLSAKHKSTPKDYETHTYDVKDQMNSYAFSGVYGIGWDFTQPNNRKISLEARYANDFTKLEKAASSNAKNHGFSFMLAYSF
ncbi:porin family protein [Pedobacter sp.]|uniref:porin family protein n=1 Tax=Pedobacter sp. TaxID=1411316 RepID=UPI00396C9C05